MSFYNTLKYGRTVSMAALLICATPLAAQDKPIHELDEIIVTGSPFVRSVDEAITGLSVLSGDELSERLASTLGETLKYEPGVSSTSFGAGASRPIIRGQGGDRVRVLVNGVGSIDASAASPDHAVAAEPAQAERIEVLRGAALLRYGSSGSGGVVNVIDGRIPKDLPENGMEAAMRIGASSVDDGLDVASSIDAALGSNFVLHVDGTFKEAGDYDIPGFAESAAFRAAELEDDHDDHDEDEDDHEDDHEDEDHDEHEDEEEVYGTLENSATKSHSLSAGLSYVGERGFFGFAVQQFESDYGIPGGHEHHDEHEDEDHDDDHDEDEDDHEDEEHDEHGEEEELVTIGLEQTRFDVNGGFDLDGFFERVQVFGGYADYAHIEFEGDEVGTVFSNEGYELRGELIQAERSGWSAAYGAQLRNRQFSALGAEAFVPPTETLQLGLYSFHEKELADIHIEGAARIELTEQENSTESTVRDFETLSVSLGADKHFTDQIRVGGTVFRTQRAPSTEELYSDGPHLATGQYERGDATLDVETASGVELAFRHREANHSVSLNVFYTHYDDYIYEVELDEEIDELPLYQFFANDANFSGFEIQGDVNNIAKLGGFDIALDGQAAYVLAETDTDNLPRIPPLSILTGVEASNDALTLRAELDYNSEAKNLAAE